MLHLIRGQQFAVHGIDSQIARHRLRSALPIAGQHHAVLYAARLQIGDRLLRAFLFHIGNHDVAQIRAVRCHVHHGAGQFAFVPFCADTIHQLAVAHGNMPSVHHGGDAVTGDFFDVVNPPFIDRHSERMLKRQRNRMAGMAFRQHRDFQQFALRYGFGVYGGHFKAALGERAGLIEHNRAHLRQRFHIVAALDQNTSGRCAADAAEEAERYGNHQRARTGYHQEDQRAGNPFMPVAIDQRRHDRQRQRAGAHGGRIIPRKLRDEVFRLCLLRGCVFHQIQYPRHGGFAVGLIHAHAQHAG